MLYSILSIYIRSLLLFFFFFNDTATTEIYTLSLHDALPIFGPAAGHSGNGRRHASVRPARGRAGAAHQDRKSTRLNSSHLVISYAVFCLKKKKQYDIKEVLHPSLLVRHYVVQCVLVTAHVTV